MAIPRRKYACAALILALLALSGQLAPARCEDPLESDGLASLDAGAGDDGGGLRITATDQDAPSGDPTTAAVPDAGGGGGGAAAGDELPPAGIIDEADAAASAAPGLTPLAQAASPLGAWLAAVDAAGPLTPLSDPLFEGTVFIPTDQALAASGGGGGAPALAALLNSLAAPGEPLRAADLAPRPRGASASSPSAPSRLRGAGGGEVVVSAFGGLAVALAASPGGAAGAPARVVEADLQCGRAVAHALGSVPLASGQSIAGSGGGAGGGGGGKELRFGSALEALRDPAVGGARFAALAAAAGLEGALGDAGARTTVFAPSDEALEALIPSAAWPYLGASQEGVALAEGLVARHWSPGAALGAPALLARAGAGADAAGADGGRLSLEAFGGSGADGGSWSTFSVEAAPAAAAPTSGADGQQQTWRQAAARVQQGKQAAATGAADAAAPRLAVAGFEVARLDAGLGRRCAVHVMGDIMMTPDLAQRLEAFLPVAASAAAADRASARAGAVAGAAAAAASGAGRGAGGGGAAASRAAAAAAGAAAGLLLLAAL